MSAIKDIVVAVESLEESFQKVNTVSLPFSRESEFALQTFENNDYLISVAAKNMQSLRNAVVNVAAVGLTLNPVLRYAYLVTRGGKICLDFSYMGMTKVAVDSGSVTAVRAEVVYEKDHFEYMGPFTMPIFRPDCFAEDRGKKLGVWCAAKTDKGEFIVGFMSLKAVHDIRDRFSESWKSHQKDKNKSTPWVTDEDEMIKKTIIKREYKMWPKTERLANAINALNEHEGIDFENMKDATPATEDLIREIKEKLAAANKTEKALLNSLPKHDCEKIEDFSFEQAGHAIKLLNQLISKQKKETA